MEIVHSSFRLSFSVSFSDRLMFFLTKHLSLCKKFASKAA